MLIRVLIRVLIRSAASSLVLVLLCLWMPAARAGRADTASPSDRLASLQSAEGWELAGDTSHDQLGAVSLSLKQVDGVRCPKGTAMVAPAPAQLLAVVDDVAGALSWGTAGLSDSRELSRQAQHSQAVEPVPNCGAWVFEPVDGGTRLDYTLCTESGSLPQWLQRAVATRTMPAAMADVVVEAARRVR